MGDVDKGVVAEGGADPEDPCRVCDPASPKSWSARPDGATCGEAAFCAAGACTEGRNPNAPILHLIRQDGP